MLLAEKGIIDFDYIRQLEQFKKEWSEDDNIFWRNLKDRVTKDSFGTLKLDPPLSSSEKSRAKILVQRMERRGLC
jgi:hypothetical protein